MVAMALLHSQQSQFLLKMLILLDLLMMILLPILDLLPCAHMRSRVMRLIMSVCVRISIFIYLYMSTKKEAVSPLENLLLSVVCCLLFDFKHPQCGLLHPASYTDRAIHAFPNNTWRPPGP